MKTCGACGAQYSGIDYCAVCAVRGKTNSEIADLRAQLAAANKRASEAEAAKNELIRGIEYLVNDHACYTGDCPHRNANQCTSTIRAYLVELIKNAPVAAQAVDREMALRARCERLEKALRGIEIVDYYDTEKVVWFLLRSDQKEIGAGSVRLDGEFAKAMHKYALKRQAALAEGKEPTP